MGMKNDTLLQKTTDQGFLINYLEWNEQFAEQLAEQDHIQLSVRHWEIILFIRNYYQQFKHLPNARMFTKAIAKELGGDKGNSRYLHQLFPDGPLKCACKLAGLPKPPSCL